MSASDEFARWRKKKDSLKGWGLAWYLAHEFCQRYYSSHGIVPWVADHEGLGYYGIELNYVQCKKKNPRDKALGRMTIGGDVENWRRGSPGDRGLPAIKMCSSKIPTAEIVHNAITHMGIEPFPAVSHLNCRHKRWGASYMLCFEIATILALRHESEDLKICNHPEVLKREIVENDPKSNMTEHLGAFLFDLGGKRLLLAADGRILDGAGKNIWQMYMEGHGITPLADMMEKYLTA